MYAIAVFMHHIVSNLECDMDKSGERPGIPIKRKSSFTSSTRFRPRIISGEVVIAVIYKQTMNQEIRYCTTRDGVSIAFATVGSGLPIVKTANWLSHLEHDWRSPVWRHVLQGLSAQHRLVRYDERGTGLSERDISEMSVDAWMEDLTAVVDELSLERFALLGISQGGAVAIKYAVRHPERVSHLILYGAYARGRFHRGDPKEKELVEALRALVHQGWGSDHHVFRQMFTTLYIPDAGAEHMRWFNDLQRVSASPENAEKLLLAISDINVSNFLSQVKTRTLVLHCRGDRVVPFSLGQELAARIPNARFVPMDGNNHLFLDNEPACTVFMQEVSAFLGDKTPPKIKVPDDSPRLTRALSQAEQNPVYRILVMAAVLTTIVTFFVWLLAG